MARSLARFETLAGSLLLGIIVVLVFVAAVMRFFDRPLIWSVDLAQLLFIWLCFIGASRAMRDRAHLGVDLLVRRLPVRARLAIEFLLAIVFIAFMAVIAVEGTKLTLLNRQRLFGDSGLTYAYVTIAVPVGCLFLTLSILVNALEAWRARARGTLLVFARLDAEPAPRQEP